MKNRINKMFLCESCTIVFQIHSPTKLLKPYCPICGDNADIVRYVSDRYQKKKEGQKIPKIRWTESEIEFLKKCIDGEFTPHQVAIQLGRSINSVMKKLGRLRKEIN